MSKKYNILQIYMQLLFSIYRSFAILLQNLNKIAKFKQFLNRYILYIYTRDKILQGTTK